MFSLLMTDKEIPHGQTEWRIYATVDEAIISSDNGLSPVRLEAIIWACADLLSNGPFGTNISEVECIIVKFDNDSWGQLQRARLPKYVKKYQSQNGTPIYREQLDAMGNTKGGKHLGFGSAAKIIQFPLIPFYASTNHKIQVKWLTLLSLFSIIWFSATMK